MVLNGFLFLKKPNTETGFFIDEKKVNDFNLDHCCFKVKSVDEQPDDNNYLVINSGRYCTRLTKSKLSKSLDFVSRDVFDTMLKSDPYQPHLSIWYDDRSLELSIIRHNLGILPLYYVYIPGQLFAFSTEIHSLIQVKGFIEDIGLSDNWISNYITSTGNDFYNPETAYSHVKRLLPGHNIRLTHAGNELTETPYYSFHPEKWNHLKTVGEYGEAFKGLFQKSITRCITNSQPVVAQLSGGLDSSSISCMLRELHPDSHLHTVFLDLPVMVNSEKHLALEVAQKIHSKHHIVSPSTADLDALILHTSLYGYPEEMVSGSAITHTLLKKATEIGANTMLNGHDGDGIIGIGIEYPEILYEQFRWQELQDLLNKVALVYPYYEIDPKWDSFSTKEKQISYRNHFLYRQLNRKMRELNAQEFLLHIHKLNEFFGSSATSSLFLRGALTFLKKIKIRKFYPPTILRDDFLQNLPLSVHSTNLPEVMSQGLSNIDSISFRDIYGGESLSAAEHLYALRKHYGIIEKFPFLDNNLFELAIAIPLSIKFDGGRRRSYLREGMKGILPENVRNRGDKGKFSLYGREAAIRLYNQSRDFLLPGNEVWKYIDINRFNKFVDILQRDKQPGKSTSLILRVVSLAVWLDWLKNKRLSQ